MERVVNWVATVSKMGRVNQATSSMAKTVVVGAAAVLAVLGADAAFCRRSLAKPDPAGRSGLGAADQSQFLRR